MSSSSSDNESRQGNSQPKKKNATTNAGKDNFKICEKKQNAIIEVIPYTLEQLQGDFEKPHKKASKQFWHEFEKAIRRWLGMHYTWPDINRAMHSAYDERGRQWKHTVLELAETKLKEPSDTSGGKRTTKGSSRRGRTELPSDNEEEDYLNGEPAVQIVFCGVGKLKVFGVDDEGAASLAIIPTDPFKGAMLDSLSVEKLRELEQSVGEDLCSETGAKAVQEALQAGNEPPTGPDAVQWHLHSILVSLLYARYTRRVSMEFHDWAWLKDQIEHKRLARYLEGKSKDQDVIVFTLMRRPNFTEPNCEEDIDLTELYTQVSKAKSRTTNNIDCYPSKDEAESDASRISDLRCLDKIAKQAETPEFRWRPEWCAGLQGPCDMAGYSGQVIVRKISDDIGPGRTLVGKHNGRRVTQLLECSAGKGRGSDYCHQELVPTLTEWGVIDILMIGDEVEAALITSGPGADGSTYRASVDGEKCFTSWNMGGPEPVRVSDKQGRAKQQELFEFCSWARKALMALKPDSFKTFEVATRFTIGISEQSPDARFFIHDIPRWTNADLFVSHHYESPPYDKICQALGKKFARTVGRYVAREAEQNNEDDDEGEDEDDF